MKKLLKSIRKLFVVDVENVGVVIGGRIYGIGWGRGVYIFVFDLGSCDDVWRSDWKNK